jgi:hypothetical protein
MEVFLLNNSFDYHSKTNFNNQQLAIYYSINKLIKETNKFIIFAVEN